MCTFWIVFLVCALSFMNMAKSTYHTFCIFIYVLLYVVNIKFLWVVLFNSICFDWIISSTLKRYIAGQRIKKSVCTQLFKQYFSRKILNINPICIAIWHFSLILSSECNQHIAKYYCTCKCFCLCKML